MGIGALLREKVAQDATHAMPKVAVVTPEQEESSAEAAASKMASKAGKKVGTPGHKKLMGKFLSAMKTAAKEQEVPADLKKKWKKDDKKKADDKNKEPPEDNDDDDEEPEDKKKVPPFMKKKEKKDKKEKKEAYELISGVLSGRGTARELVEAHFSKKDD